jgi:ABC-type bacteriocin/lantibiotic exporter with double-glycine peptidase domain
LLPSVNRIIYSYQAIQYSKKSCSIIIREFKNFEEYSVNKKSKKTKDKKINFENEIQLKNISFSYGSPDNLILNNLDLNIRKGEVVGIIGKSGSGKSTLVNIILGLLKQNSGNYLIDNVSSDEYSFETKSQLFGYVPQDVYLINDSIKNNIAFGDFDNEFDKNDLAEAIKLSSLDQYVSSLKHKENSIVGERGITLSGGQRQRVSIARALYNKPEILVFDEATSSLDANTENSIINEISNLKNKKTILIITHRESILSICDKVYKLENKTLYEKN